MKPSNVCLHKSEIPLLLSGELPADEAASAESHIAECESCRSVIESMIADSCWWNEARQSLAASATRSHHQAEVLHDAEPTTTQQILDLLGPTDDPNMLGCIGPYEIIGLLGQGGMGAVFKGFDRSLNRFVAIKMLLPHLAASGAARKRFAREGQAVAAVVDDHVMAIHCVDEWQGVPYLVMTYSRGVSLQKRLSDNGPLEVREILRIGMQAAKGLAAAHAQGIVHRDIKPANIFLDQSVERVQLMDFGLARAVDDASLTRSGTLAGTPQYMSPEQARAETVDHRSDLFSLGSVMYAMCTGHAPFRAESSYSVLRLITDKEPRPIQELNSDIPEWLCRIVNKLMAKQASDRFESAQDIAELLEDCLAHVQQPAAMPLPAQVAALAPKITRRPPIGKFIAAAAGAFALFFAGILIVLELGKGTLTIESEMDNVPIRIVQRGEVVERLTVTKSGNSVRVAAGTYVVELETKLDGMVVENGYVSLKRGGTEHVMIRLSTQNSNVKAGIANQSAMESTDSVATFSAPGERAKIMVDVYGGNRVLGENNAKYAKLVQDLNAIDGVQVNFREAGPGNEIAMVIVRDLTGQLNQEALTTGKPSARRDAMSKALAQITDVRWEEGGQTSVPPEDGTVSQAVKVNLRFSETREVVLSMGTLQCMLDLDTGETCPAPARMSDDLNKFDLKPMQDQPREEPRGLKIQSQDATMSFDAFAVASELWDLQESKVLSALATDKLNHVREIPLRDGTPNTYFFRTSPGTRGLLQLVGCERIGGDIDAPWGIRIRYKTPRSVDPAREVNASNNSRDAALDGNQKGASKPKRLQIREANVVDASVDSSQPSVESKVVEFSGMRLRLDTAQPAILTEDDIMTVESVTDPSKPKASPIVLTLTPEAGQRFLIETTRLSSQPNPGYLVMEFDGTILSAPRVNDKISSKVAISASKDDDMERLVAAIRESIPTQPTPIQRIQRGLTSNQSDVQKAQYLRQFFSVGESYAEVLKRLQVSEPGGVKGGPLQTDIAFDSCDLVLSFDAERKLFRIGYYVHSPALQSPEYHELVPDLWVKVKADRQIVNDVVRAFMKDAGDVETTKTLTRDLPQAVTAKLFSLAAENALNELPMEFDYVNDSAEPTKAIATLIALTFEPQSIGLTKEVFVVFRLTMTDDGWVIDDIDFESKEDADRERKSFLNANPNSVPSITQMKLDRSNARLVVTIED